MNPLYKYPHNYPKAWVNQQYLPDNIKDSIYYSPNNNAYENNMQKVDKERRN